MPEWMTAERWEGIRELCEGGLPTHGRVAKACGVYVKTMSARAGEDKWKTLDLRRKRVIAAHRAMIRAADEARAGEELDPVEDEPEMLPAVEEAQVEPLGDLPPGERIARMGAILARRTEAMLMKVEAGQPLEGRQVAALSALVQLSERIAVLAREEAGARRKTSNAELALTFRKINWRMIVLSRDESRRTLIEDFGLTEAEVDERLPPILDEEFLEAEAQFAAEEAARELAEAAEAETSPTEPTSTETTGQPETQAVSMSTLSG